MGNSQKLDYCQEVQQLLTRLKGPQHLADYKVQNLSSAGLGDNILKYIEMPGRVQIEHIS